MGDSILASILCFKIFKQINEPLVNFDLNMEVRRKECDALCTIIYLREILEVVNT